LLTGPLAATPLRRRLNGGDVYDEEAFAALRTADKQTFNKAAEEA
jgi:hypothetical protein